jgi:hypothetical protein
MAVAAGFWGCSDTETVVDFAPEAPITEAQQLPETTQTRTQEVVDQSGPNWFLAGEEGLTELAGGEDGEPDVVTGRFVLDGDTINDASFDSERWVVVGQGRLQVVDGDAARLRDVRQVFNGESVRFIHKAPLGWVIGGDQGHIMALDVEGEPTETTRQILGNAHVVDAAWNGTSWLFASANQTVTTNASLTPGTARDVLSGNTITALASLGEPNAANPTDWIVFGGNAYEVIRPSGAPQGPVTIEANLTITDAIYHDSKILVGAADGRVGIFNTATRTFTSWNQILTQPVQKIEFSGTNFLVLGESGQARLLNLDGTAAAPATDLATDRTPVAAWLKDGRWLVAVGAIGFVEFVGEDLSQLRTLTPKLDGRTVRAADVTSNGILIVGDEGRMQLLDSLGQPTGSVQTLGTQNLNAVAWNGEMFLVAGQDGFTQLVNQAGEPQGSSQTLLDGKTIRFAAWGRGFWLIGGDDGAFQRVRPDGMSGGSVSTMTGATRLYASRSNTNEWLVAGVNADNQGIYGVVGSDGLLRGTPTNLPAVNGPIYAAEFNGLEWLLGGAGGRVVRLNNEGVSIGSPIDVLNGYDIHHLFFNGSNYLVAGQFGAMRRLAADLRPVRAPIALVNQRDVHVAVWTRSRGFAGGICMTNTSCFNAPCVGGIESGVCCDAPCDRACESCLQQDTGVADGTCAPVVAGKQPPTVGACRRAAEDTCGFTGTCDGAGECAMYGADIECETSECIGSSFTDISFCDGSGTCRAPDPLACAPYVGCSPVSGCATSCALSADCIDGYECIGGECKEPQDPDPTKPGGSDGGGDDGGCATTQGSTSLWMLVMGLFLTRRRRAL